jgi:hypothetical protein
MSSSQNDPSTALNPEASVFQPTLPLGSSQLPDGGDITNPMEWPTVEDLVRKLLDPPHSTYNHPHEPGMVKIHLTWCQKTIGEPHFVVDHNLGRVVLKPDSKIRSYGCVYLAERQIWTTTDKLVWPPACHSFTITGCVALATALTQRHL